MKKPYAQELAELSETFQWACTTPAETLSDAFWNSVNCPLQAVGSGGSLTTAHHVAALHGRASKHLSTVLTPLEVLQDPKYGHIWTWLVSAGGRNPDILAAADVVRRNEKAQFTVLCATEDTDLRHRRQRSDPHRADHPDRPAHTALRP